MDVLEHLITALRTILDYVGVDLEDLPQPEWLERRAELSTRYRSLVRLIASLLPPKPAKRLRLQPTLIGHSDRYGGSLDSFSTSFTDDPMADLDLTPDDLVWVEEDLGNNCIQMRAQVRQEVGHKGRLEEMDKGLFVLRNLPDHKTSTPINQSLSLMSQTDPGAMMKISALEDELVKLRLQIAQIVVAQENTTFYKSTIIPSDYPSVVGEAGEDEEAEDEAQDGGDCVFPSIPIPAPRRIISIPEPPALPVAANPSRESSLPSPPTPPSIPAPPTPPSMSIPPPPPLPPSISRTQTPRPSMAELLAQRKSDLRPAEGEVTPGNAAPSLADVLCGLGSVKLRSVQRSPGGTPLRSAPRQSNHTDPTFLIAQALKKKFAFRNVHDSPDTDKENDFSSPETTPKTGSVPLMLRNKIPRRRSSLCTDSSDLIGPSAAPLRDRNIRV